MARSIRVFLISVAAIITVGSSSAASGKIVGVHGFKVVSRLTGSPSLNNTKIPYDIGGTDLGIPVSHNNKTYFLFGDTFSGEDSKAGGNWRRNTVSWSSDTSFSDGIIFDDFAVDPSTLKAKQTFTNNQSTGRSVITNIPTGGISVNGSMYAWFMNVIQWGPASGEWYISQAELAKWNDATQFFELVSNSTFSGSGNFGMVAAREGVAGDPYIYLWGTAAGRFNDGVKLARFLPSQIETRSAYQFYDGMINGVPQWTDNEFDGDFVVSASVGEMSVMYNYALGAWTMLYMNDVNDRFQIRQSETPWGPWSAPVTVMTASQCPSGTFGLYAPYMYPQWVENSGSTIYFTMSLWIPYDVYIAKVTLDIAPGGSVTINNGADYTSSRSVTLTLSATDDSGTVTQMRISNDGVFDTEPWENYATSRNWTLLPGDGAKTVYVKFRDASGYMSDTVVDSVILDTTAPTISSVTVTPHIAAAGDAVKVSVTATDNIALSSVKADGVELAYLNGSYTGQIDASDALQDHTVSVTATDAAGNSITHSSAGYKAVTVVGLSGKSLPDAVTSAACANFLFKIWGKATIIDASSFYISYGSGTTVRVVAPGYSGVANGDTVSARGILDPSTSPPTLNCMAEMVTRY